MHNSFTRRIVHLGANRRGRDFFVGDIHGAYDLLLKGLASVEFDTSRDRLIATGDLVDRGEQNIEVLKLTRRPWFFSVRGNHDAIYQSIIDCDADMNDVIEFMSGKDHRKWYVEASDAQRREIYDLVRQLPHMITVEHQHRKIAVVHADLPYLWSFREIAEATARIVDHHPAGMPEKNDDMIRQAGIEPKSADKYMKRPSSGPRRWRKPVCMLEAFLMFSRLRFERRDHVPVGGIDAIVVGHNVVEEPLALANVVHIDMCGIERGFSFMQAEDVLHLAAQGMQTARIYATRTAA